MRRGENVEGEAVKGTPARYSNTTEGDLGVLIDPDAGLSWHSDAGNPVLLKGAQDDLFEGSHVPADIGFMVVKVNKGLAHRLFGAVVGDASAPFNLNDGNTARFKLR